MHLSFWPVLPLACEFGIKAHHSYFKVVSQGSNYLMDGIQKNLQTLMSTLQKNDRTAHDLRESVLTSTSAGHSAPIQPSTTAISDESAESGGTLINDINEEGWEQLWSEFVTIAPELDAPQWSSLLEDVDFNPQLDVF